MNAMARPFILFYKENNYEEITPHVGDIIII